MNNKQVEYEKIEHFLSGKMPEDERLDFEKRFSQDRALAEEVRLHREIQESINDEDIRKIEGKLNTARQEFLANEKAASHKKRFLFPNKLLMVASIALLVGFVSILFYSGRGRQTTTSLFAEHYDTPVLLEHSRSDGDETAGYLQKAYSFYEKKDFKQALLYFENTQENENQTRLTDLFYMGICQLETGESAAAIQSFQKVGAAENHAYKDAAKWYLSLVYISQNQTVKATGILKEMIANSKGKYQRKGKILLEQLD